MSAYLALLDGGSREEPIEVRQTGPRTYEVRLRGEVHVVDAFEHDHGTLSLVVDTASYTARLDRRDAQVRVGVNGSVYPIELLDERGLRRRAAATFTPPGPRAVTAPVPGRIARVLVEAGDAVRAGQGLVVVEAMQMENEMKSPKDGTVIEVLVAEGQDVPGDAKLCVVE